MVKNEFVQMLVTLQKKGVSIYLTDEGFKELCKLIEEESELVNEAFKVVG